jgi:hypothetical protein
MEARPEDSGHYRAIRDAETLTTNDDFSFELDTGPSAAALRLDIRQLVMLRAPSRLSELPELFRKCAPNTAVRTARSGVAVPSHYSPKPLHACMIPYITMHSLTGESCWRTGRPVCAVLCCAGLGCAVCVPYGAGGELSGTAVMKRGCYC